MDSLKNIGMKVESFYLDCIDMPDIESRLGKFLFSEIVNDLNDRKIENLGDWLKYHSTNVEDFNEIVTLSEGYYYKALKRDLDSITFDEKILIYNSIALYSIEMDVEMPTGVLLSNVIQTFIEIIRHYDLFLKGYLSLEGEILISNRTKCRFFSNWETSTFKKKMPITLFAS